MRLPVASSQLALQRSCRSTSVSSAAAAGHPQQGPGALRAVPLPTVPNLEGADPVSRWNPASLAYLGDAVWEVHMRTLLLCEGPWDQATTRAVTDRVSTRALAAAHDVLMTRALLSPGEEGLLRWAANSATVSAPPHVTRRQYKKATAVEVLVAQLYLTDAARLAALVAELMAADVQVLWAGGGSGGNIPGQMGEAEHRAGDCGPQQQQQQQDGSGNGSNSERAAPGNLGGQTKEPRPKPMGFGSPKVRRRNAG